MTIPFLQIKQLCEKTKLGLTNLPDQALNEESWFSLYRIITILPPHFRPEETLSEAQCQQLIAIIVKRWDRYRNKPLDYTITSDHPITILYLELATILHSNGHAPQFENAYHLLMPTLQVFQHFDPNLLLEAPDAPYSYLSKLPLKHFVLTDDGRDFIDTRQSLLRYFAAKKDQPEIFQLRTTHYLDPKEIEATACSDSNERFMKATSPHYYEMQRELSAAEIRRLEKSHRYNSTVGESRERLSKNQRELTITRLKGIIDFYLYPIHLLVPKNLREGLDIFTRLVLRASIYESGAEEQAHSSIYLAQDFWMRYRNGLKKYHKGLYTNLMNTPFRYGENCKNFSEWIKYHFYIQLSEVEQAKYSERKRLPIRYCASQSYLDLKEKFEFPGDLLDTPHDRNLFAQIMGISIEENASYTGHQQLQNTFEVVLPVGIQNPEHYLWRLSNEWENSFNKRCTVNEIVLSQDESNEITEQVGYDALTYLLECWNLHCPNNALSQEIIPRTMKNSPTLSVFKLECLFLLSMLKHHPDFGSIRDEVNKCERLLSKKSLVFINVFLQLQKKLTTPALNFVKLLITQLIERWIDKNQKRGIFKNIQAMHFVTERQFEQLRIHSQYLHSKPYWQIHVHRKYLADLDEVVNNHDAPYILSNELLTRLQTYADYHFKGNALAIMNEILGMSAEPPAKKRRVV